MRSLLLLSLLASLLTGQGLRTVPLKTSRERSEYRQVFRRIAGRRLSVEWKEAALDEVVKQLRRTLGINLIVDRELKGREAELVVTMTLRDVRAPSVIRLLEDQLGVRFQHRAGIVHVTTPEAALKRSLTLSIHGIATIVYVPPDFPAPDIGIRPSGVEGGLGADEIEDEGREGVDPEFLIELIRQSTGEKNWEHEGVSIATMGRTRLVVRHTPEMQRRVRRLLSRLRGAF